MEITGKIKTLKLTDIQPYKANNKIHSAQQVQVLKDSIIRFGYRQKVAVDENNILVIGEAGIVRGGRHL